MVELKVCTIIPCINCSIFSNHLQHGMMEMKANNFYLAYFQAQMVQFKKTSVISVISFILGSVNTKVVS